MDQARRRYPSDLTNQQWEVIKEMIPAARFGGRPRTTSMREIINAVFYVTRSGCAWRYLPKEFPPWKTVYDYFSRWRSEGTWRNIHLTLAEQTREESRRSRTPSVLIIDGQSVRAQYGEERGYDGFKKVRGRKRQIVVDTMGIIWGAKVHAANQSEGRRGFEAIDRCPGHVVPKKVLGDFAYTKAPFDGQVFGKWRIWPEANKRSTIVQKDEKSRLYKKITVSNLKPQRWIVERSFAWLNNFRRLNRDYERKVFNSEVFLFISQTQLLLNRLRPP